MIILTLPLCPSLNRLWQHQPGRKGRQRTPEYNAWLREAGWQVRRQLAGMPPLACRYNMEIQVPVSRRDTGNWEKAISDLLQHANAVTNDGNLHEYKVTPVAGRADIAVCLTPLPEMGGVRKAARSLPVGTHAGKPRVRKKGITTAMQLGFGWRG